MKTLETDRLILRDWENKDLDDLFAILSNPNVSVPEGSTPVKTKEKCDAVLNYLIMQKNSYAIELKSTGSVIGGIGLNEDAKGEKETRNLGFYLAEEYWNRGIMTEALTAVIESVKEITSRLSATQYNNPKSEHLLIKLGFQQVDVIRNIKRKVDVKQHTEPYYLLKL